MHPHRNTDRMASAIDAHKWRIGHQSVPKWVANEFNELLRILMSATTDFIAQEQAVQTAMAGFIAGQTATIADLTSQLAAAKAAPTIDDSDLAAMKTEELRVATLLAQYNTSSSIPANTSAPSLNVSGPALNLSAPSSNTSGPALNLSGGLPTTLPAGTDATTTAPTPVATAIALKATDGILTDSVGRAVYTYTGPGTPDPTAWPTAGTYTTSAGDATATEKVYYFSGDAAAPAGTANGVTAGVWQTIPAPAAPATT